MDIRYVTRSEFLWPIVERLRASASALDAGDVVEVSLKPGGYVGAYHVTIRQQVRNEFGTSYDAKDPTRFPVRIRAAATALRDLGLDGQFFVSHQDGELRIRRS